MAHLCNPINKVTKKASHTNEWIGVWKGPWSRSPRVSAVGPWLVWPVLARVAVGLRPPSQNPNGALPRNNRMMLGFNLPYWSENAVTLQNPFQCNGLLPCCSGSCTSLAEKSLPSRLRSWQLMFPCPSFLLLSQYIPGAAKFSLKEPVNSSTCLKNVFAPVNRHIVPTIPCWASLYQALSSSSSCPCLKSFSGTSAPLGDVCAN